MSVQLKCPGCGQDLPDGAQEGQICASCNLNQRVTHLELHYARLAHQSGRADESLVGSLDALIGAANKVAERLERAEKLQLRLEALVRLPRWMLVVRHRWRRLWTSEEGSR